MVRATATGSVTLLRGSDIGSTPATICMLESSRVRNRHSVRYLRGWVNARVEVRVGTRVTVCTQGAASACNTWRRASARETRPARRATPRPLRTAPLLQPAPTRHVRLSFRLRVSASQDTAVQRSRAPHRQCSSCTRRRRACRARRPRQGAQSWPTVEVGASAPCRQSASNPGTR